MAYLENSMAISEKRVHDEDAAASLYGSLFPLLLALLLHLKNWVGYLPEAVREFFPFFLVIFTFYSLFGLIKCTKIFFWRLKDKSFTKIALNVFVLLFVLQSVQLLLYYKFSLSAWYLIVLVASMILIEPMAGAIALGISGMRSVKKHFGIAGLFISLISLKDVGYIIIVGAGFIVSGLLGYVPF
jgi:hypothetical protein